MVYVDQRVRDPVHNLISFDASKFENIIWRAIQTRPFQRLRRIKQLGFSDFVYPGATHSRFAHSVGVFHTARQLMDIIRQKVGSERWDETQANTALAAALLHDVGHGPFSHAFEDVGGRLGLKLAHHEEVSDQLIRDSDISVTLKEMGSGFHNDVADVIKVKRQRSVYDAVVSSQFDADRLDYVRRDRMMAGSSHGVIDYDWLVNNLIVETISTGVDEIKTGDVETFVIRSKGIFAAEAYVLGLFQLYPTIYLHKTTRGIEKIFTELLVRLFELARDGDWEKVGLSKSHPLMRFALNPESIEHVLCLDDTVIYGALSELQNSPDPLISEFSTRIRDRNLFECFDVREHVKKLLTQKVPVSDLELHTNRISDRIREKVELWRKTNSDKHLLLDVASRSPYKKFDESKGPLNQIMVQTGSEIVDLGAVSPVVSAIPTFRVMRYYFDRNDELTRKFLIELTNEETQNVG